MKVLVISHNVFSLTESMGKTLTSYFSIFSQSELAQFYIHSQIPTNNICHNYYRVTDKEAIKSILGIKVGKVFHACDIERDKHTSRTDSGVIGKIYQKARSRTPMIYFARNVWWKLSRWDNKQFKAWLDDFCPDCVFFASGDYAFMYEIALKISKSRNIPLYISCMDDYYFFNMNNSSLLGRLQHGLFMKTVSKAMAYATTVFCICEKMSCDYSQFFKKRCVTIHTPSVIAGFSEVEKKPQICYLGNLGAGRDKQLIEIGRALQSLNSEIKYIDVYSSESRKEILQGLNIDNGIRFHGSVAAKDVIKITRESLAIIHTESFDNISRQTVKYSVSTKIADALMSGTCIFAYGPEEIASIAYLKNGDAALCCTDKEDLANKLYTLINNKKLRNEVLVNAKKLAQNHLPEKTPQIIIAELERYNRHSYEDYTG